MKVTNNISEVKKLIYSNELVLVAIVKGNSNTEELLRSLLGKIEIISKGRITSVLANFSKIGEKEVVISLYVQGQEVFRQEGLFGNAAKDYTALKWSIREVLKERGIRSPV